VAEPTENRKAKKTVFNRRSVESFGRHFLIICPNCRQCAQVLSQDDDERVQTRMVCACCGLAKTWVQKHSGIYNGSDPTRYEEGAICIGAAVDWYFHAPLWLQESCCGETLWAYNADHLDWLEDFVSAELRKRSPDEKQGWSNRALVSRLPKWIKKANNRKSLLQAIARMRKRLEAGSMS
jgi:hypothetical protein